MSRMIHHVTTAVKGCTCDGCERQRKRNREYMRRKKEGAGRPPSTDPRVLASRAKLVRAEEMLEDGATYLEVAESLEMSTDTLRAKLPGYRQNAKQFNSVMSNIKNNEFLLELHREIWQGGQYNKS